MKTESSQAINKTKLWLDQFVHERPALSSIILMLIGIAGLVYFFFSILPPPSIITRERMKNIEKQIRIFKAAHPGDYPDLNTLKDTSSEKISIMDGWDRPILYRAISKKEYELTSYGEDGVPGGKPDFIHHFTL